MKISFVVLSGSHIHRMDDWYRKIGPKEFWQVFFVGTIALILAT